MNVEMRLQRAPRIDLQFGIGHSWENGIGARGEFSRMNRDKMASNTGGVR